MYQIKIYNKRRTGLFGRKREAIHAEFEFKDRDLCELAYANLYGNTGCIPMCAEVAMYDEEGKIKSFRN